jgi:hypothetical protein
VHPNGILEIAQLHLYNTSYSNLKADFQKTKGVYYGGIVYIDAKTKNIVTLWDIPVNSSHETRRDAAEDLLWIAVYSHMLECERRCNDLRSMSRPLRHDFSLVTDRF